MAVLLTALYTMLLLCTVDDLGYTRDEGFYFHAADRYAEWFHLLWEDRGVAWSQVDLYWRTNSEHPAFLKSLFAWSHMGLWERSPMFSMEGTSYRFPGMILSSAGVGLVYLWGARVAGPMAGMVAALSLAAMPRFFFHAHLACFDAPVVTMWTACAYAYWRAIEIGGWRRALIAAIAFGFALNTKHNAWFLPIVCGGHAAMWWVTHRRDRVFVGRAAAALTAMAVVGPVVFFVGWPWIWSDTWARLVTYATFHLDHVYYNMEFLGRNYFEPPLPRTYAFVMTAATVPMITLVLFVVGAARFLWARLQRGGRELDAVAPRTALLWLLAIAVQYGAWLRPTTPIFGGTKHWMTAYPFVALFAGVASVSVMRALATQHRWARSIWARACVAMALVVPAVVQSAHAHPWGLTAYTPVVGGAQGGATLGLNRGFWGHATGAVADVLNREAPPHARIYIHDTAWPAWKMLLRDGRLRRDLRGVGRLADADLALYHHELHMLGVEYQSWVALHSTAPIHVAGLDGVPVVWVYARQRVADPSRSGAR